MDSKSYQQLQDYFLRCRAAESSEERQRVIDEIDDETVRRELLELLAADEQSDGFLESAVNDVESTAVRRTESLPRSASIPDRIGEYRLLQRLGEGGHGTVYMAQQRGAIDRKVAIKLIKPGMDSEQVLARFFAERQALAMMDHPSIARVFDAGETEQGYPYFVMELVNGVPIHEFCTQNQLPLEQRLRLFVQVCNAVQHAHQKGVIHRDLKPSNIMVSMAEDAPIAKVIDFGIAKALDARLTNKTLFTEYGQMIGTLEYMSPEQAEMSSVDIDTRSDIYSLGVVLYLLLTGETPLSKDQLLRDGFLELHRRLRDTEPVTPSARITSTRAQHATVGREDWSGVKSLPNRDLDWITMKAIGKDRRRRYDSAKEFAADISRHLSGLPVEAHPPSAVYRLSRLLKRHWVAAVSTTVVAASLVIGLLVALYGLQQAKVGRAEAEAKAYEAEEAQRVLGQRTDQLSRQLYSEYVNRAMQEHDASRAARLLEETEPELRGWEWGFVKQKVDRAITRQQVLRESGAPSVVQFDVDEKNGWMACTTEAGGVEIRSLEGDTQRHAFTPQAPAVCCRITAEGNVVVVGTRGGHVELWDLATGKMLDSRQPAVGAVYGLSVNDDASRLAVTSGSGRTVLLSLPELEELDVWQLDTRLADLDFSHDETELVGAGLDGRFYRLAPNETQPRGEFVASGSLGCMQVLPRNVALLVGSYLVQLAEPGSEPQEVHRFDGQPSVLAHSERGLASGCRDGTLIEFANFDEGKFDSATLAKFAAAILDMQWLAKQRKYLISLSDGRIVLVSPSPAEVLEPLAGIKGLADGVFLPKREMLAALSLNGQLQLLRVKDRTKQNEVAAHGNAGWSIAADLDEQTLVTIGEDRILKAWSLPDLQVVNEREVDWGVRALCVSPNGKYAMAASEAQFPPGGQEGIVTVWSVPDFKPVHVLRGGHTNWVTNMVLSDDGKQLVTSCEDHRIVVWDLDSGELKFRLGGPQASPARRLCIDDQRHRLLVGHEDGAVSIWDLGSKARVAKVNGFGDAISGLGVTPDGRMLVTSRSDSRLKVFEAETFRELMTLDLGLGYLSSFRVTDDGEHYAVGTPTGTYLMAR